MRKPIIVTLIYLAINGYSIGIEQATNKKIQKYLYYVGGVITVVTNPPAGPLLVMHCLGSHETFFKDCGRPYTCVLTCLHPKPKYVSVVTNRPPTLSCYALST